MQYFLQYRHFFTFPIHIRIPTTSSSKLIMDFMSLQTQVAHGPSAVRPTLSHVASSGSSLSSNFSSARSASQLEAAPTSPPPCSSGARCTRCGRAVSVDGRSDGISYHGALHYCRSCTAMLERRGS